MRRRNQEFQLGVLAVNEPIDPVLNAVSFDDRKQFLCPAASYNIGECTSDVTRALEAPQPRGPVGREFEVIVRTWLPIAVTKEEDVERGVALSQFTAQRGQLCGEATTERRVIFQNEKSRRIAHGKLLPKCQVAQRTSDHSAAKAEVIATEHVFYLAGEEQRQSINGGEALDAGCEFRFNQVRQMLREGVEAVRSPIEIYEPNAERFGEALSAIRMRARWYIVTRNARKRLELRPAVQIIGIQPRRIASLRRQAPCVQCIDAVVERRPEAGLNKPLRIIELEVRRIFVE